MSDNRIRLKVLGLSVGQIRQGAYALILAQADGPIRIPVVIGVPEANAIAARMDQSAASRRPMVHDLFSTMTYAFGIVLQEVFIHKFEDGVFYSELRFTDGERRVNIDSRTSDAIAIAMRTGAPIYTTPEILQECGFVLENEPSGHEADTKADKEPSEEELRQMLAEAIAAENYEEAARINAILEQKKNRS